MARSDLQELLSRDSFGDFLVGKGLLDDARLQRALRLREETGEELETILTKMGFVSERSVAKALAEYLDLDLVGIDEYPATPVMAGQFSGNFIKDARVIPLADTCDGLVVAMARPTDLYTQKAMAMVAGKPILPRVGIPAEIEAVFERIYGNSQTGLGRETGGTDAGDDRTDADDIERLKGLASEAPIIRLVNSLIARAVELRASDIHVEPFEKELRVRYRIDGVLRDVDAPPAHLLPAVISRIKIMANLDIAERRLPQDGRIRMIVRGNEIDLRISIVPTVEGENAVIRILDRGHVSLNFPSLGFYDDTLEKFLPVLRQPNGILLVTGPTGSGKTTTLYTCLSVLNTQDKKLLSVEDPVEYQLKGVNQIQVRPQIGLDFARALRAFLRQDPDIIMVGEIRDVETAEIAVQAALTGHLVLSTLHTNDAATSVTRLLDMGVEDYLLTSTLNAVLAQRLVRTLCSDCREPFTMLPELAKQVELERYTNGRSVTLFRPVGCRKCGGTGYFGRSVISELLLLSNPIRQAVLRGADSNAIHAIAVEEGMQTMYEDGMRKVVDGLTTLEEVLRVTRET